MKPVQNRSCYRGCFDTKEQFFASKLENDRVLMNNIKGVKFFFKIFFFILVRSELDSELLDDRSTVLGVLTADDKGLCLLGKLL